MFLSQIKLLGNAMAREERQKLAVNGCYASHQLLWKLFAGEQKRGFLYCTVNDALDQFMVLSAQEPKNYNEIFAIQTKRFNPVLYQGQKLSYQITLNPTVCKNNRRHDVVMNTQQSLLLSELTKLGVDPQVSKKSRLKSQLLDFADDGVVANWKAELQLSEQIARSDLLEMWLRFKTDLVLRQWWSERLLSLSARAELADCDIFAYQQHQVAKGKNQIRFSTVDIVGQLEVTDPEKFTEALFNGIGRSKAFGCGLMLIKPL
ncbi:MULTISPECIES: type I-E CRISPR-associated protein Cas6/Cse3/CasE [unclassified Pseudoalteromonas]|uniref:type I-E CRISPR-associated protein Cas6/Cse3/CasE n=1 Tax=unclassified Pseudoalteromonas TaxID=194690 RepID=UPI0019D0939D|nr:type I-E CRISPR-associated protein Cas6/Cse3/CasE [Pseudoalteromonas sp. JC3]MBR8843022.1 type I-E CRISPR-associated protein Cas6/Cse3/CasE [Pseudoalteromonas sp. JC3]WJE10716.1 type I-E CRISPR-associated protein Cas6/Cse3/CasE [Pseudoalteromonas sp. JC3]